METTMTVSEIVKLIAQDGMSVVIIGYFLYKDYRFNQQILDVLSEVREVLSALQAWHAKEDK